MRPTDATVSAPAFLFPGQGAQQMGMGQDLARHLPMVRDRLTEADRHLGMPLTDICFNGPVERLDDDLTAQLAVYTLGAGLADALAESGIRPAMASGYSSGFYAAAYAAGCFDFIQGLDIVAAAGRLLLAHGDIVDGAMGVIIGLDPETVTAVCRETGASAIAIYNTPRQLVIAGPAGDVDAALDLAMERDALDAYRLTVATAYHSTMMKPVRDQFREFLDPLPLRAPQCPLIGYSHLLPVSDADDLKQTMADQLYLPVHWPEVVNIIRTDGVAKAIEVGPGAVIARATHWIDRDLRVLGTGTHRHWRRTLERLSQDTTQQET